jgi:hypothetical protein
MMRALSDGSTRVFRSHGGAGAAAREPWVRQRGASPDRVWVRLIQPKTGDKHHPRKDGDDQQFGQNEATGSQNLGYSSPAVLRIGLLATRLSTSAAEFAGHGDFNNSLLRSVCRKRRSTGAQVQQRSSNDLTLEGTCTPTKKWGDYFDARQNQLAWILQTGCAVRCRNKSRM